MAGNNVVVREENHHDLASRVNSQLPFGYSNLRADRQPGKEDLHKEVVWPARHSWGTARSTLFSAECVSPTNTMVRKEATGRVGQKILSKKIVMTASDKS